MSLHLSDHDLAKLRQAIGKPIQGEWMIKLGDLGRILHLAGQNLPDVTVNHLRQQAEELHKTDEVFLDDIEPLLAPVWEDLNEEEINQILLDAFETFDIERQGFLPRTDLIDILSQIGDMPLSKDDFQLIFSLFEPSKNFDYRQFAQIISGVNNAETGKTKAKKAKKKRRRKKASKRSSR